VLLSSSYRSGSTDHHTNLPATLTSIFNPTEPPATCKGEEESETKGEKKSRSDPLAAWFFPLRRVNPQAASGGGGWRKRAATVPETHKIPARSESKQLLS